MSLHLIRDLESLHRDILAMCGMTEDLVGRAVDELGRTGDDLVSRLAEEDRKIDWYDVQIEEKCLKILALHQPVAIDLRRTIAALKISKELERVADIGVHIAERVEGIRAAEIKPPKRLSQMAGIALDMLRRSIDAYVELDTEKARAVCDDDDIVDEMNRDVIRELIVLMREQPDKIEPALSLFSASRHLERVADHATNIAEEAVYMANDITLSTARMNLPTLSSGSVDSYLQAVSSIPVLDVDHEQKLARRLRDDSDIQAAQKLILSNLRFVVHVARGYSGYGLPLSDLVQEGNIGLMKAVKRFDPDVGVRLISFAVHWIRAEIHEFILRNWRIVKVATTKAQRKLFFNLRSSKKRLGWMNNKEVEKVAGDLGVKPETVLQMERRLSGGDTPYNALPTSGDESSYAPEDYLSSEDGFDPATDVEDDNWQTYQHANLTQAMTHLDTRSRDILQSRWLREDGKIGLQELGNKYKVSAERIRQLEVAAIKKLRGAMVTA